MTDIMKLAEAFADACADVREFLGANAGMNEADGTWIASQQARTALQSAITSMQAENERLKREIESQYRCIKSHAQVTQKAEAERDQLQAEIKELESWKKAARDKLDWQQTDNRLLRVQLETNEAANKTRISALQAKLDAMGKGEPVEPVAWFAFGDSNGPVPLELFGWDEKACKHAVLTNARAAGWKGTLDGYLYEQGWTIKPVYIYAAPKALAPEITCKGRNCAAINGRGHSSECLADHDGCAEGFGNKHPEFRYAGYKNYPLKAGATREQIAAYEEGKNAQHGIGGTP